MVTERSRGVLDVKIEPMKRRHIPAVLRIESKVYPRPWSAGLFLSELAQRSSRAYLVAKHAGKVVGYAGLMLLSDEGHVTNIAVDPDFHRQKVGSRLLLTLVEEARAAGAKAMTLEVRRANHGAQDMYRQFGFQIVGLRRGYYVETGEDAFIMLADKVRTEGYEARLDGIREGLRALEGGERG